MDLSREEAAELFPDDRGESIDKADIEPWMQIYRGPDGWVVETEDNNWTLTAHQKEALENEQGSIWVMLTHRDSLDAVLDRRL